jgi:hypothetical protein
MEYGVKSPTFKHGVPRLNLETGVSRIDEKRFYTARRKLTFDPEPIAGQCIDHSELTALDCD